MIRKPALAREGLLLSMAIPEAPVYRPPLCPVVCSREIGRKRPHLIACVPSPETSKNLPLMGRRRVQGGTRNVMLIDVLPPGRRHQELGINVLT